MAVNPDPLPGSGPQPESLRDELSALAIEELDAACALTWVEMKRIAPWGDTFEGFAPSGRQVEIERRYLWAHEPAGGILVEIEVRDPAAREGAEARAVLCAPL